jgi:hypothetical protein
VVRWFERKMALVRFLSCCAIGALAFACPQGGVGAASSLVPAPTRVSCGAEGIMISDLSSVSIRGRADRVVPSFHVKAISVCAPYVTVPHVLREEQVLLR